MDPGKIEQSATAALATAEQARKLTAGLVVSDTKSEQFAIQFAKSARAKKRELEHERDLALRPLKDVIARITNWFREPIGVWEHAERICKSAVSDYQAEIRRAHTAALVEATSAAERAAAVESLAPKPVGYSERDQWSAEVVDSTAVPREFLVVDQRRLDQLAREQKDALAIPGVRAVCRKISILR